MEAYGGLRLCPRPWPRRPLSRPLFAAGIGTVGTPHQIVETAGLRCLCLFRQRPEERGAGRCAGAEKTAVAAGLVYGPPATEPAITMTRSARSILPLTTSSSEPSTLSDCGRLAACRLGLPIMASLSFSSSMNLPFRLPFSLQAAMARRDSAH